LLSSIGVIGSRISSEAIFSIDMAALMGIGLVAKLKRFLHSVNSLLYHSSRDQIAFEVKLRSGKLARIAYCVHQGQLWSRFGPS
jgi:hypothetical protein